MHKTLAATAAPQTRRAALRRLGAGLLCSTALLMTRPVLAAQANPNADGPQQAEWPQLYESAQHGVERSSVPVLSQQTYVLTEQAIGSYRQIAAQGGWGSVPVGQTIKLGTKSGVVTALRQRLIASGDLDANAGGSPIYDSFVEAGVKRFQERHGLLPTGIVAQQTLAALNVSVEARLRQLEINLVRLKSFTGNLGARYVMANIPAARVETVDNGVVFSHHQAGVGKIDRQSPVMNTRALDVNFNPTWTVPASIIRKDLIPKMQADSNYLNDNKIRVINKQGQVVPPTSINWNSLEATNYQFRQDSGGDFNSLGVVRINIANPYGVYMHDTPAKGIFGDDFRFVSSGCMRIQNVRDYVAWLLKDTPGWSRDQIDEVIRSGQRVDARLAAPVAVYWVYITAWASSDGVVQFRDDIYNRDSGGSTPGPAAYNAPATGGAPAVGGAPQRNVPTGTLPPGTLPPGAIPPGAIPLGTEEDINTLQ